MRIAHEGAGVRIVGGYLWGEPGEAVEIPDAEIIVRLLLQPGEVFHIAPDEPLLRLSGMNEHVLENMALEGIGGLDDLAGLSARAAGQLAKAMGLDRDVVKRWAAEAKEIASAPKSGAPRNDEGSEQIAEV